MFFTIAAAPQPRAAEKADRGGNRYYVGLQKGLGLYERIARNGGWPAIPDGPTLKPDLSDPRVSLLRSRLTLTLDATGRAGAVPELYDDALRQAVIRFQRRNGIEPDGIVGPETLSTLNISVAARLKQIRVNMDRWRRMPDYLGNDFVLVNMAGFELELVRSRAVVLDMKVVVGKNYRQTPIFSDMIQYVEVNPYWNVPVSIAQKDLVPKFAGDPGYPVRNGFEILRNGTVNGPGGVDWAAYVGKKLPYSLRQKPGPLNALGRVKIMFPNKHNVYLHDTSAPELFSKTVRTFSSGCIRVERPIELVRHLLADNPESDLAVLDAALETGRTTRIVLKKRIPVHLVYMTAWLDRSGVMQFRPDIYGRDAALALEANIQ